ncbi:MAG: hypothetical protein Q8O34_08230 [Rhodocyclaceae bacterium]|nr:hypothetical protein [Rhodocyclaceae bacterium]
MTKRIALCLLLCAWMGLAVAQSLEIVTLRHRVAEQVLPELRPLLEPGATLSGSGDKLFLRASPRNRAEIMQVLEAIDRAPRRLMITVRQGGQQQGDRVSAGVTARLVPGDSTVRGHIGESRYSSRESIAQQVQTIEGGRAAISVGQSVPLAFRQVVRTPAGAIVSDSVVYRDIGTGFLAQPRLSGGRVTLEISPGHDTPGSQPGSASVQRLSTTVSGRLGEWIVLGGSVQDVSDEQGGMARYSTRGSRDERQVWLKVDEFP